MVGLQFRTSLGNPQPKTKQKKNPHNLTFDHGDVVGTVADGQRHGVLGFFDQLHDQGLLQGRHPAAYHRPALHHHLDEQPLHLGVEAVHQRVAVDDDGETGRTLLDGRFLDAAVVLQFRAATIEENAV